METMTCISVAGGFLVYCVLFVAVIVLYDFGLRKDIYQAFNGRPKWIPSWVCKLGVIFAPITMSVAAVVVLWWVLYALFDWFIDL